MIKLFFILLAACIVLGYAFITWAGALFIYKVLSQYGNVIATFSYYSSIASMAILFYILLKDKIIDIL